MTPHLRLVWSQPPADPTKPPTDAELAVQYARAEARLQRAQADVQALFRVMAARAKVADKDKPRKPGRPRAFVPPGASS